MGRIAGALPWMGVLALGVVASTSVSCYSPPAPACGFQCNAANRFQCPAGYTCAMADGVCRSDRAPVGTRCPNDAAVAPPELDADPTSPRVTTTTPADHATNVSRTTTVAVTFSRDVVPPNDASFLIIDNGVAQPGTYTYDAASFTSAFTPAGAYDGGHLILVEITGGVVGSGPLSPPAVPYSFSFQTFDDEPPRLASSTPLQGATMVPTATTIVVGFSEPVTGVDATSFTVAQGATGIGGTIGASADHLTYTFTPSAALPAASVITVTLGAAIDDLSAQANPLAPTTFSFTTQ